MRQRIQTLDGLRFLAAIGVLWIHVWTRFGNPRCAFWKIELTDILAIGGNGFDLFFVISGFCMYYFYASKSDFSYHDFYRFLIKRWIRLSPAFYVATIIYILAAKYVYQNNIDGVRNFLHSLFYLNHFFEKYTTASHFWTLSVEWQFYFIIPFLLIYQNRIGFKRTFLSIFVGISIVAILSVFILKNRSDLLTTTILFHIIEFGCGIVAARFIGKNYSFLGNRILWLIVFVIITYVGRLLISKQILALSSCYYNLLKLLGLTLMGVGFAGILYLSVTSTKWLNCILGNKFFRKMGRISYSFYLWHGLIIAPVSILIQKSFPYLSGILAPVICTIVSAIILYPISQISYNWLEKPYLSSGNLTAR